MARKLSAKQMAELEELHRRSSLILAFMRNVGELDEARWTRHQAVIDTARNQGDLRGLRAVRSDDNEWIRELPHDQQARIKSILSKEARIDLDSERRAEIEKIHNLEQRGRIETEEEYRLVLGRVEEIYDDPACSDEVQRLNALLRSLQPSK